MMTRQGLKSTMCYQLLSMFNCASNNILERTFTNESNCASRNSLKNTFTIESNCANNDNLGRTLAIESSCANKDKTVLREL